MDKSLNHLTVKEKYMFTPFSNLFDKTDWFARTISSWFTSRSPEGFEANTLGEGTGLWIADRLCTVAIQKHLNKLRCWRSPFSTRFQHMTAAVTLALFCSDLVCVVEAHPKEGRSDRGMAIWVMLVGWKLSMISIKFMIHKHKHVGTHFYTSKQ